VAGGSRVPPRTTERWQRYGGGERSLMCIWGCLDVGWELYLVVGCFRYMVWVREGGCIRMVRVHPRWVVVFLV